MAARNNTQVNTQNTAPEHKRPVQPDFYMPAMPPLGMLDDLEQWTRRQVRRLRSQHANRVRARAH